MMRDVTQQEFEVKLEPTEEWVCFVVPFNVEKTFGSKATIPVKGRIDGFPSEAQYSRAATAHTR